MTNIINNSNTTNILKTLSTREKTTLTSPKIKQYLTNNENFNQTTTSISYRTNQKFSDYYPIFTTSSITASMNQNNNKINNNSNYNNNNNKINNINLNITRSNSCLSSSTKSANSVQRASVQQHQPKQQVKANIRDTQWIKENILRNLQIRKPIAAAQSVLNSNATTNSAATSESQPLSTTSSYLLATPSSTIKPLNDNITTPTNKINQSSSTNRQQQQKSSDGVKKVEFVNLNENNSNMNSFQRLCELASRWNNKNRLASSTQQNIKTREKKYSSNSTNNFNNDKTKNKSKQNVRKRTPYKQNHELEDVDLNSPASTNSSNVATERRYSKIIAKNFIQLRPVNENDTFKNIHYAFSTSGPKTPPLIDTPILESINNDTPTPSVDVDIPSSNKWNNNNNLIKIQQPLHVS